MKIGLIGLPKSGKTTLFNLLTGSKVATARYDGGRAALHTGVGGVPDSAGDPRLHLPLAEADPALRERRREGDRGRTDGDREAWTGAGGAARANPDRLGLGGDRGRGSRAGRRRAAGLPGRSRTGGAGDPSRAE